MTAFDWSRRQIEKSIEFAETLLRDDLTLEQMASEAGYSRFHFARLFKSVTGTTPLEYVRKRRLTEAKKKLLENRGILSTALEFGYSSQESFTHAFSMFFGLSPGVVVTKGHDPTGIEYLKTNHGGFVIMDQRKEWRIEQLSHQLFTLSRAWAHEATTLGPYGRGLHVVASETRVMSQQVANAVELYRFDRSKFDINLLLEIKNRLKLLALNSIIEAVHSGHVVDGPSLSIADELRQAAEQMDELLEDNGTRQSIPQIRDPSSIVLSEFAFIQFYINGVRYIENLVFIKELVAAFANSTSLVSESELSVRGTWIPICTGTTMAPATGMNGKEFMIVGTAENKLIALAVEPMNLDSIFTSRLGTRDNEPETDPMNLPVREQWTAMDGSLIRFVDWDQLQDARTSEPNTITGNADRNTSVGQ